MTAVTDSAHDATATMGLPPECRPSTAIRPHRRLTGAILISSVVSLWLGEVSVAAAEFDPVALLWNAPGGCSSAEAVHDQVEKSLGGSPKDLAPVAVVADVSPVPAGRWQAKLTVHSRGERAERRFEAESCDALASAAAVIIALAAEGPASTPRAGPAADPQRRDGEAPPAIAVAAAEDAGAAGWQPSGLVLRVDLSLDNGTMPRNSEPGIEAAGGRVWASSLWRLRLLGGLSYFFPQENSGDSQGSVPFGRYWLLSLSSRGCVTAVLYRFEIGPCVGGELVAMHGSDIGGGDASSTQSWLSPVGAAVMAFTVAPGVSVFAQGEVAVPGTHRTYNGVASFGSVLPIYTVSSHTVRVAAGIELSFF